MYPAYIQRGHMMNEKIQVSPPPYQQIADRYRHLIAIGRFKAGDRLPALAQIATDFHVSPRTANKALKLLAVEGLVVTSQQGSRVKEGPSVRAPKESVAPRVGPESLDRVTVTSASKVATPELVKGTLATDDVEVFRREAVTEREGRPHTFSVCWVPLWAGDRFSDQLQEEEHIPSLLTLIAPPEMDAVPGQDWVTARTIESEREAAALKLEMGDPTLAGASIWTASDRPLLYREWMSPAGEQVTYEYTQKVR